MHPTAKSSAHGYACATVAEIRALCRGQIAHYKILRYVKFVDGFR
jgi:hypothetical protein